MKSKGGGKIELSPEEEYEDFLEHLKKARTAIGKNDTKTLRELSFGKLPYGPNELSKDYVRAQELRKAAGLGLKDDVNLALPHLGQQIRGTANKVLGTHYKYGGKISVVDQDPEMINKEKYNTPLKKGEKRKFATWVKEENERQGRDIMFDKGTYDVQGFWKSGDYKNIDGDGHGSDKWKKPNHPTFSNESIYRGSDKNYGGKWGPNGAFFPSGQTKKLYGKGYYDRMFGSEPDRSEHLDPNVYKDPMRKRKPLKYGDGGQLAGGAFSGATTGMSMGSVAGPIGMGVGAVIGGITGLFTTKKRLEEEKELKEQEERERKRGEAMIQKDYSNAVLSSFPTTGIRTQSFYGMGGAMKRYQGGGEMEGLGSSQMPAMMPPGSAEENTYMSSMTDGPTHEQGGIPIPELGAELEGGELVEDKPDGFYVYSKRIKIDPTPYKKFMK